ILAGPGAAWRAASGVAPGATGARVRAKRAAADSITLRSEGFYPVISLGADAVPLERAAGEVVVAARRVGAGRVLQVGYDATWQWRVAGQPGSDAAHRRWWSQLVA